jgi:error-prone DNA polymerase
VTRATRRSGGHLSGPPHRTRVPISCTVCPDGSGQPLCNETDALRLAETGCLYNCKSHAAEFARTIYQTAWLKAHYPAHYLAAFLSAQPAGFFPPHVVLQEAKRLKIPVLGVDINRSEDRFTVERVGSPLYERWAIRIGLAQVTQVGEELAQAILWARRQGSSQEEQEDGHSAQRSFSSLSDVCQQLRPVGLTWPAAEALILAGAFDSLRPAMECASASLAIA